MKLDIVSATGNTFALIDAFDESQLGDAPALAIAMCKAGGRSVPGVQSPRGGHFELDGALERPLDGMLVLAPSSCADVRMILYNADGSRPETCGNGLRATAMIARRNGRVGGDSFAIESDAGVRSAEIHDGRELEVRVSMGVPKVEAARTTIETSRGPVEATLVDMGNPHCVLFVSDVDGAPVDTLGPELEVHPRFPARTNVEFASVDRDRVRLRVWERGVGETAACGSGACAAAVATLTAGRGHVPIEVELPGGKLAIEWDGRGEVFLRGEAHVVARGRWIEERASQNVVLVPFSVTPAAIREKILALASRHSVKVESDDGARNGVLAKNVPFLGRAAVRYEIHDAQLELEILDRPRGLSEDMVKRALVDELARALKS